MESKVIVWSKNSFTQRCMLWCEFKDVASEIVWILNWTVRDTDTDDIYDVVKCLLVDVDNGIIT